MRLQTLAIVSLGTVIAVLWCVPAVLALDIPVCVADEIQSPPVIVSDGAGGAIVAWSDRRNSTDYDIYAQHVLASGSIDPAWPSNGVALCTASADQTFPAIASDGAGGAIVAYRHVPGYPPIRVQHVLASGAVDPGWPLNGRGLGLGTTYVLSPAPAIVSDGAGGAVVAWSVRGWEGNPGSGNTSYQIYADRVLESGALAGWTSGGVKVCTAPGDQILPTIVAYPGGGAYIAWEDRRGNDTNIAAQLVLGSGVIPSPWPPDGGWLTFAPGDQRHPAAVADGAGGAFVAWTDGRAAEPDIYCQRVLSNGEILTFGGNPVCTASGAQRVPQIASDGGSGAIISWHDQRSGTNDIYAHHVVGSNQVDPTWPADGRALCTAAGDQDGTSIISDGAGGAIVTWSDLRTADYDNYDVYAQHVLATGMVDGAWPVDGLGLGVASGTQWLPRLAPDGHGGAIIAWQDFRDGPSANIYASAVTSVVDAPAPQPPRSLTFASPWPNPARGSVSLRLALPWESPASLNIHDAGGRLTRSLFSGTLPPGERTFAWNLRDEAGRSVPPGLYWASVTVAGERLARRFVVTR